MVWMLCIPHFWQRRQDIYSALSYVSSQLLAGVLGPWASMGHGSEVRSHGIQADVFYWIMLNYDELYTYI